MAAVRAPRDRAAARGEAAQRDQTGERDPAAQPECTAGAADLTWLLHRSAQRLRWTLDQVAADHGLTDSRDWVVLGAVLAGPPRTQLAIAHELGLDKTTLTALLDRLEAAGLVVRAAHPTDRRARLPRVTPRGERVHAAVVRDRDRAECALLGGFEPQEQELLRRLLTRLAEGAGCPSAPPPCS